MEYTPVQVPRVPHQVVIDQYDLASNDTSNSYFHDHHHESSDVSDSESCCTGGSSTQFSAVNDTLIRLVEGDSVHDLIKRRFVSGLGLLGKQATVVSIHLKSYSSLVGQARMQAFRIFANAVEKKCGGGNGNVKFGWYGGSREEISNIMKHGFGSQLVKNSNGLYGRGIYLTPDHSPIECVKNLSVDEDGLRHLLLCRVIIGKPEVVHPGSDQSHPSSDEFDSGVDNLSAPNKYIVWSTHMNTHILPEYVISFRAPPCLKGYFGIPESLRTPSSPWVPFSALFSALSKSLPPPATRQLTKLYKEHKERKISRQELIHQVRKIAGDKLLIAVIKSFRHKFQIAAPSNFQQPLVQNGAKNGKNHDECRGGGMDELIMLG